MLDRGLFAVDQDPHVDRTALAFSGNDPISHVERLADETETRRVLETDATVLLMLVAGDQRMQWRVEVRSAGRRVMHLAVGDHDRAADARGRHVAESAFQHAEQPGFGALIGSLGLAGVDHADVELLETAETLLKASQRLVGLLGAVADVLALAAVDDDGDDALQRLALLVEENWVEQRAAQRDKGDEAQERAALAEPQAGEREQQERHDDKPEQWPGNERSEGD